MKPKVRFKGFEEEWKESQIGDILTINSGQDYKHLQRGDIPVYGTGGYMLSVNRSLSDCDAIGIGRKGTIDRPQYLTAPFWTVDTLFFLTSASGDNLNFLYNLTQCIGWKKYDESTGVPSLSKVNIGKIRICLPTLPEQTTIATFFTHLDTLISSTSRRLEKLRAVKAAALQTLFPQEGEKEPRVRFKGFCGEWVKVQLGDIATFSKGHGYSKNDIIKTGTPIILYGSLYTKYQFAINGVNTFAKLAPGSVLSEGNEVVIPASGETTEDIARASAVLKPNVIIGGDLNVLSFDLTKFSTPFIALIITNGTAHYTLSKSAQGKTVVHLNNGEIRKASIYLPSLPEQTAIANYFTHLDDLIASTSRRLDKLRAVKSACLEGMFV